ncbi:MAG: prolipoprotein diacylglyceryl transferase [bacterium]|nr:prolipoprotein diacylglyceryl transferase [bacterium]
MSPVIFQLGPFVLRWYGLMYVVAVLVGARLVRKESERRGLPITADEIMNFALIVMFAGILGGRIYYVIFNWDFYGKNLGEIVQIWHGGLAIHGGMVGGVLAGLIYLNRHPVSTWDFADAVAPAVMLGQVFGRFGNFMNGDAHGMPTALPWGVVFPAESIAGRQFPGIPLHPVMIYELLLNLLWFFLLRRLRLWNHRPGFLFCLYFILYSIGRAAVSGFRADSLWMGPVRAAYVASAVLIVIFGGIILKKRLWTSDSVAASS